MRSQDIAELRAERRPYPPPLSAETVLSHIANAAEYQRQRLHEPHAFESYLQSALCAYAPHHLHAHWAWLAMDCMRAQGLVPQQPARRF